MATGKKRAITVRDETDLVANTVRIRAFDQIKEVYVPQFDVRVDLNKLPKALERAAIAAGVIQTVRRAMNLGATASMKQKFDAAQERATYLTSNPTDWETKGTRTNRDAAVLMRALALQNPKADGDAIRELVENWSTAERDAVMQLPEIAPFVAKVRAEMAKQVDVNALSAQLKGLIPTLKVAQAS